MESREIAKQVYPDVEGYLDQVEHDRIQFIRGLEYSNKHLLDEIERLKETNQQQESDIKRFKSIQSQETTRADELQNEVERLKIELKDCMENYNHYVDKCFKLESELKDKDSEKNIDLSVYTESFLIWLNKYFEPAYKVLPYKSKLNPNNFYSMIELEQKFNKAYNIYYKYQQPKTL